MQVNDLVKVTNPESSDVNRAGIDLSLEHAWRSEGTPYKERAFMLGFGLSIRPYGEAQR